MDEYRQIQRFTIRVATEVARGKVNTQFSAYGFSYTSQLIVAATTDLRSTFIPEIQSSMPTGLYTNIHDGVQACLESVREGSGNRVIVLLTDGDQTRGASPGSLVPKLVREGIALVSVAVGDETDVQTLKKMATRPDFFVKTTFKSLPKDAVRVTERSCKVVKVARNIPKRTKNQSQKTSPPKTSMPNNSYTTCKEAYKKCDFTFAKTTSLQTFNVLGRVDKPFTPKIVSKDDGVTIGIVNSNNIISQFIDNSGLVRNVTKFGRQPFSPTVFKPYTMRNGYFSGVGHETYQGNQRSLVSGRCVRVFFTAYQVLSGHGASRHVVDNVHVGKKANKCVVFRTA